MYTEPLNAAAQAILLGAKDSSIRPAVIVQETRPTHCPLSFIFAERGPADRGILSSGSNRESIFGSKTFDVRSEYATHALVNSNGMNEAGNASQMYVRLIPEDAPGPATQRLWADVLPTQIPQFERNPEDNSIVYDPLTNKPIETGETKPGFEVMFVIEEIGTMPGTGEDSFGRATIGNGTRTDPTSMTQSRRFPIRDLRVSGVGKYGNNIGSRIAAPVAGSNTPIDMTMIEQGRFYPYRFSCLERTDEFTNPRMVMTLEGDAYIEGSFKQDAYSRRLDQDLFIGDKFIESWERSGDPMLADTIGPFGEQHIYVDYIEELLQQFYDAEVNELDPIFSDFRNDGEDEIHVFNFIGGTTSAGVPYHTYRIIRDEAESVVLSEVSTQYSRGGGDGTMNAVVFDKLVREYMSRYADPNDPVQDTARRVESILYDTGFTLETKYELPKFTALRKDTAVGLTPFDALGPKLTPAQESSLAISLRTRAQMFTESEAFGTPAIRTFIVGRTGTWLRAKWRGELPLILQLARWFAQYMGAGNGFWNTAYNPEGTENENGVTAAIVTDFSKISNTWTPVSVRNKDWDAGLITPLSYDTRRSFIPAFKTIYDNDTSIFTSVITMFALIELQKVAEHTWRNHTGKTKMTDEQICASIDRQIRENVADRFDNRFTIIPRSTITGRDRQRGYSWTTVIELYANNMRTVGTYYIEGFRAEDAPADQGVRA